MVTQHSDEFLNSKQGDYLNSFLERIISTVEAMPKTAGIAQIEPMNANVQVVLRLA